MMRRAYLDNNASAPIHPVALEAVTEALLQLPGNASSVHEEGRLARRRLEEARETVAVFIGATANEIVFTSGGTESNNTALRGVALRSRERCHIVTTAIEHPSVLSTATTLRDAGCELTVVGCDRGGVVSPDEIAAAIHERTCLVAVMLANNETGVIQRAAEIGAICRERRVHYHCDASQAAGRIAIDVEAIRADTLTLSAHKMHGPKGIGALYVRKGSVLAPAMTGGAQERRRRAGTESVPLAIGFATAAAALREDEDGETRMRALRDELEAAIVREFPFARINGGSASRIPNTANLCFAGHDAEGIVIALDLEGVAVSTGSACSSGRIEPSHVLIAMGLSEEDARSSVRFSLGRLTIGDDVQLALERIRRVVPRNRKHPVSGDVPLATTGPDTFAE